MCRTSSVAPVDAAPESAFSPSTSISIARAKVELSFFFAMPASSAHIAGVGVSHGGVSIDESTAISAAVKALLDAGVTYGEVQHSVACFLDDQLRIPPRCFDTLGMKGAAVSVVDNDSGLFTAVQYIKSGQANCVLVLGIDRVRSSQKKNEDLHTASNEVSDCKILKSD